METETTKTLEPPHSQVAPCTNGEESGYGSELGLVVGARENEARVSVGDAKVTDEVEDKAQCGAEQDGILSSEEVHGLLDSGEEKGGNLGHEDNKGSVAENGGDPDEKSMEIPGFESEMCGNGDVTREGERKYEVNGDGNENEEDGEEYEDEDVARVGDEELGLGVGAHENGARIFVGDAEVTDEPEDKPQYGAEHNGISLIVEVHGSLDSGKENGKNGGHGDNNGSMAGNGGDPDEKSMEIPVFESKMGDNRDAAGEGERKYEVNAIGNENEEDEDAVDEELEYFVGDFVWGKIRGHPWWPGQIYDPSDASEYARKYDQRERLLVGYFGDGSFSWCTPSQLKPFAEGFEEMSKQSDSKSFVNALQKALDEIGRLVELKMTCSCIPEENRVGLARPLAKNAGIKQGVLVPEYDMSILSVPQLGPVELYETLRCIAEVGSSTSLLDLTVLRSYLSAFYRAKGGQKLAVYQEPQFMEELEDENREQDTDFSGPSKEDSFSSPGRNGFDRMNQPLLQKCRVLSEDNLLHKRKRRSVAKLMKEHKVIEVNSKKKRKGSEEQENQGGSDFRSPSGEKMGSRKVVELLGSPKSMENSVLMAKNEGSGGKEEETKHDKESSSKNDDSDAKEETENVSLSRKRKISKYLSPPFTSLHSIARYSCFKTKRDSEAESLKIASFTTKAADQLPVLMFDDAGDASDYPSPQPPKEGQKKIIDTMEINASTEEVVSEVKSAALNPVCLRDKNVVDMMGGFISAFRSAIYLDGLNYKMYQNLRPGRKRKHLNSGASNVDEASRLLFIKQKLEMMTQMLENCDGNKLAEMKSNLEGEMKGLLEKVSSMAESILS
ncbi:PWWP domain-containing protein 3-like [Rhododendron vialii]|uniref:PWWP domain-containing protein 3-like n=1 Tax=Rhododendron vialii TaxID=182163 RepID=UPI00265ED0E6|nr:PWWP domain-containing protein 3-like [Rhododendron vialii]